MVYAIQGSLIKQRFPSTSDRKRTVNSSTAFQFRGRDKMRTFETRRTIMC